MALNEDKYSTGGGFGGAFSTTMSGGQAPGQRKSSAAPGGISLRGATQGAQASKIRPAPGMNGGGISFRPQDAFSLSGPSGAFNQPGKQGMSHVQPETGFLPKIPNPGGMIDKNSFYANRPPTVEAGMAGGTTAPAPPSAGPTQQQMIAEQDAAFKPQEIAPGVFRDQDTNSYADSAAGTQEGAFTRTGQMGVPRIGGVASTNMNGPFGRSPEEQTAIENRVGEIQRATDFIRSMRDIPTEREKLQRQAGANISLDQGLGSFLSAGSQRNYARERLTELDKNQLTADKQATANAQNQFDNQIAMANLQKGVFAPTYYEDADGNRIPAGLNTISGEVSRPADPTKTYTPLEAKAEAEKMVDKILSEKKVFDTEEDALGMTRQAAIEQEMQKLMGNQQQAPAGTQKQAAKTYSQEDLEYTAKQRGMTVEEVKAKLGVK